MFLYNFNNQIKETAKPFAIRQRTARTCSHSFFVPILLYTHERIVVNSLPRGKILDPFTKNS